MARLAFMMGSLVGFLSVAGGAFGAHALAARLPPDLLAIFDTGTRYAMLHAAALLATGLLAAQPGVGARGPRIATVGFLLGVLLFTGSLWTLALTGLRWLGAVTPLGGTSFLVGWVALGLSAWRWQRPA